jgi:diguanylate cyclase (GGDEF)-like protein
MAAPLFILSFRHRDELNRLAENAGWEPIAGRRSQHAEARFLASGAAVAVVDARGAAADGVAAVRAIGEAVEANAGALLVLLSRNDEDVLATLHELGATHFLVSPFSDAQVVQAFRFAARHAQRAGGERPAQARLGESADPVSWRWPAGARDVELNAALSRKAGLAPGVRAIGLRPLLRMLGEEGRRAAHAAVVRLAESDSTAFAHPDPEHEGGRIAHHIRRADNGEIVGRSEVIAPAAGLDRSRDALTGVSDGRAARAWLTQKLAAGSGADEPAAVVLLLALTRFDAINLAFGRASGDAVLQSAARRIERLVDADGERRRVARLAGAEFAVLLAAPAGVAEARFLAAQMVQALARPFASGDQAITIGSRAGIAVSRPGDTAAALLRRASAALAEAKGQEGSPVSLIDADAEQASARGDRLEVDLRRALNEDRIEVVFQPQVDIVAGRILGVEALARWNHPDHGELGAATLFGVAERSDYLVQLSEHVQRKALSAAAAWPEPLRSLRVAVNVTAQDIVRPGFANQFLAMVAQSGLEPERVTVEVTESGLMEDLPAAASLLAQLRRGGLRVAIDDFGTGYSSLAYLRALPLDYLKLDKRLCEDITGSPRDRVVVSSVIDMAGSLGLEVVAEGVETSNQLDLLAAEGVAIYQGFLFSPPVGTAELAALVAAGEPSREAAA